MDHITTPEQIDPRPFAATTVPAELRPQKRRAFGEWRVGPKGEAFEAREPGAACVCADGGDPGRCLFVISPDPTIHCRKCVLLAQGDTKRGTKATHAEQCPQSSFIGKVKPLVLLRCVAECTRCCRLMLNVTCSASSAAAVL